MPQFDFAHVFWPQLIWLAVIFAILFFGVVLPTLPKLGRAVDARENKIKGDIDSAEAAKNSADAVNQENEATEAAARDNARATLADAKAKVEASVAKKLAKANEQVDAKLSVAQSDLAKATAKAMTQVESIATESASNIVSKLSGVHVSASVTSAAVKAALNEA